MGHVGYMQPVRGGRGDWRSMRICLLSRIDSHVFQTTWESKNSLQWRSAATMVFLAAGCDLVLACCWLLWNQLFRSNTNVVVRSLGNDHSGDSG